MCWSLTTTPGHFKPISLRMQELNEAFSDHHRSAVLSVFVIPLISSRMNDGRLINDARLHECLEIMKIAWR